MIKRSFDGDYLERREISLHTVIEHGCGSFNSGWLDENYIRTSPDFEIQRSL